MLPVTATRRGVWRDPIRWADREFDRLLNRWWEEAEPEALQSFYPVNIHEDDEYVHVEAEMPGFTRDQIQITVENGMLHITGERKQQEQRENYHLHERRFTRYHRAFTLPTSVDESSAEAMLQNGVLCVKLPKAAEVRPRRIEVK